jgi:Mn-dependent DtxR family transcriptional regulator
MVKNVGVEKVQEYLKEVSTSKKFLKDYSGLKESIIKRRLEEFNHY